MIDTLNVFTTQDLRYKLLHEVAVVFLKRKIRLSYTCMSMKDHNMVYQLYYKTIQNIKNVLHVQNTTSEQCTVRVLLNCLIMQTSPG